MAKPEDFLQGPIPGQSLTTEPRKWPWERPPQMSSHEEVTKYYINKLADQDVMDDLAVMFDGGMPLAPFVETLTTTGVSEGLHTVDASLIANPVIHTFIKAAMTQYGIKVKDDTYDPERDPKEREERRLRMTIDLALAEAAESGGTKQNDPGVSLLQEVKDSMDASMGEEPVAEDMVQEVAPEETTQPKGLMARETM